MSIIDAPSFFATLMDAGFNPYAYSGRGMFGRRCIAIDIGEGNTVFRTAAAIAAAMDPDDLSELAHLRTCEDSMGLDTVLYFPELAWREEFGTTEDEEDEG